MLAGRLIRVAPGSIPKHVVELLFGVRTSAENVLMILRERAILGARNLRPLDKRHDDAWAGTHARLSGLARVDLGELSVRARELLAAVFPSGLAFLNGSYEDQWVQSETMLEVIAAKGLGDELDELTGGPFLKAIMDAHDGMTQALGVGESEPEVAPAIGPAVTALAQAIANYARGLAGSSTSTIPSPWRCSRRPWPRAWPCSRATPAGARGASAAQAAMSSSSWPGRVGRGRGGGRGPSPSLATTRATSSGVLAILTSRIRAGQREQVMTSTANTRCSK